MVADTTTVDRVREAATARTLSTSSSSARTSRSAPRPHPTNSTSTDHEGRRLDLEVHDRQHGSAEGGRPSTHSALLSFEWYARGVLDMHEDDLILPVPKLFFGYARDLAALFPFGVGAAGIVFPDRSTPARIFDLIAEHRPDPRQRSDSDGADGRRPGARSRAFACAPRRARRFPRAVRALAKDVRHRGARQDRLLRGVPHLHPNRPGRVRPGSTSKLVPGYAAHLDENGGLSIEGDTAALLYWNDHEKTSRPSAATPSAPATCSSATRTATSGTGDAPTT